MGSIRSEKTGSKTPESDGRAGGWRGLHRAALRQARSYHRLFSLRNVDGDKIAGILRSSPVSLLVNLFNSALLTLGLWGFVDTGPLLAWLVAVWAICANMFVRWLRAPRRHAFGGLKRTVRHTIMLSALVAVPWGWLPLTYIGSVPPQLEGLIFAVSAAMTASGALMLTRVPAAAMTSMTIVTLPLVLKCLIAGGSHHFIMAALALAYLVLLSILMVEHAQAIFDRDASVRALSHQMQALNTARDDIARLAAFDPVTGLANRREFNNQLIRLLDRARAECFSVHLLLIDFDHFKNVNDTLGHSAGDELLRLLADRLDEVSAGAYLVARLGGDEFAVVVSDEQTVLDVDALVQRILVAMADPVDLDGLHVTSSCSIGVSAFPKDAGDRERLLSYADIALYRAKETGRGRACIFDDQMRRQIRDREDKGETLARAIEAGELEVYYLPQFDMRDATLIGLEALVRWNHPEYGLLAPAAFLQVAEERGLILAVCDFVLWQVSEDIGMWRNRGLDPGQVAINIHAAQLRYPDNLVDHLSRITSDHDGRADITLEVTEACIFSRGTDQAPALLTTLRDKGYRIALDDFGTGSAALTQLKALPVDEIKIDHRFMADISSNQSDQAIVGALADMAHTLNMAIVAEGVETIAQAEALCRLGCYRGQGFLYSRPVTCRRATEFMEQHVWATQAVRRTRIDAEVEASTVQFL